MKLAQKVENLWWNETRYLQNQ